MVGLDGPHVLMVGLDGPHVLMVGLDVPYVSMVGLDVPYVLMVGLDVPHSLPNQNGPSPTSSISSLPVRAASSSVCVDTWITSPLSVGTRG